MTELFGMPLSGPANKARYTANATGLEYEYITVNLMLGENKKESFLKVSPAGKVPAFRDGDFCLFESNAICRYIARKTESELLPTNLNEAAIVDQWMEFCSHHIMLAVGKIMFNTHFYHMMNVEQDERSLKEGAEWLNNYLEIIDKQLQGKQYITGSKMTLADISFISCIDPIDILDFDFSKFPEATRLRDSLRQESFYTACHKNYKETFDSAIEATRGSGDFPS